RGLESAEVETSALGGELLHARAQASDLVPTAAVAPRHDHVEGRIPLLAARALVIAGSPADREGIEPPRLAREDRALMDDATLGGAHLVVVRGSPERPGGQAQGRRGLRSEARRVGRERRAGER